MHNVHKGTHNIQATIDYKSYFLDLINDSTSTNSMSK